MCGVALGSWIPLCCNFAWRKKNTQSLQVDKHEYNLFVKQRDQAAGLEKEAPVLPDLLVGMISSREEKMEQWKFKKCIFSQRSFVKRTVIELTFGWGCAAGTLLSSFKSWT